MSTKASITHILVIKTPNYLQQEIKIKILKSLFPKYIIKYLYNFTGFAEYISIFPIA